MAMGRCPAGKDRFTMGFFSKLKQKIADGWLKELAAQIRWMVPFFRRFWATVLVHILLGVAGIVILLATTKPLVKGPGYLYPLIPFHGKALWRLLIRQPISRDNT